MKIKNTFASIFSFLGKSTEENEEIELTQADVETLNTGLSNKDQKIEELNQKVSTLEKDKETLEAEKTQLTSDLATANGKIETLEKENEELAKQPGAESAKITVDKDLTKTDDTPNDCVVCENDDFMTALDKVSEARGEICGGY